jgi:hypothetical protein
MVVWTAHCRMFCGHSCHNYTPPYFINKEIHTMKINVYKNQREIEKTYEIDNYDLMYGTVEDVLSMFDDIEDYTDNMQIFKVIQKNRKKLNDLLQDIFPELTDDELRRIKLKELIPVFMGLFAYVQESFGTEKN